METLKHGDIVKSKLNNFRLFRVLSLGIRGQTPVVELETWPSPSRFCSGFTEVEILTKATKEEIEYFGGVK